MRMKRFLCFIMIFVITSSLFSFAKVNAISIDDQQVILKQPASGDGTCYFTSCLNMFRRRAIIDGISDWQSITHDNYRYVITSNGTWVKATITNVKGMNAGWVGLDSVSNKKSTLLNYLSTHPEGIVIHSEKSVEHAVLLTSYDSSTDTFYCIDTLYSRPNEGVVRLSSSWMGSDGATQQQIINRLDSLMYITNKSGGSTVSEPTPGKPELINVSPYYRTNKPITFTWKATQNTTHYNVFIQKLVDGTYSEYETIFYAESGLTRVLTEGKYRVQLQSTNANYNWTYTDGDWEHFTVLDQIEKPKLNSVSPYYRNDKQVSFTWVPTADTTHYNIFIQKLVDDKYSEYETIFYAESGLTRDFSEGSYRIQLQSTNSYCYTDSGSTWLYQDGDWEYFKVIKEIEKPTLRDLQSSYVENEQIYFTWSPIEDATHYNLYIDKLNNGSYERIEYIHYATSGISKTFSSGDYRIILQATNSYCYTDSGSTWLYSDGDWEYFSVQQSKTYVTADVTRHDDEYDIEIFLHNLIDECNIIVVGYKGDKFVTMDFATQNGQTADCTLTGDIDKIKVMVWDSLSRLKPLCDVEVIPSSNFITE